MQQRRPRLGDVLDDYCPRERRVTNHVVVAMIEDDVKQTRCTTCDADHEYKQARIPAPRRTKTVAAINEGAESFEGRPVLTVPRATSEGSPADATPVPTADTEVHFGDAPANATPLAASGASDAALPEPGNEEAIGAEDASAQPADDEGPVHR